VPGIGEQRHRAGKKSKHRLDRDERSIEPDPDREGPAMPFRRRAVVMVMAVSVAFAVSMPMLLIVATVMPLAVIMTMRVIVMMGVVASLPFTHHPLLQDQALHNCRSAARIVTESMHGFESGSLNAIQSRKFISSRCSILK
jgi:hypothetical protein